MSDDNDWRGQAAWRTSRPLRARRTATVRVALREWVRVMGSQVADADPETKRLLAALDSLAEMEDP